MISLLVFFFVLSVLIIVHEFGHFITAKKMGVRVERFALGFGPKIFSYKRKDTEYAICAIPLGGYVKMAGDNLDEFKGNPDEYFSKPPGKRFWIIFCGPFLNYVLALLCFWFIFFSGYPTLIPTVGGLVDGLGAKEAGLIPGDKIIAAAGQKVVLWEELQDIIQAKKVSGTINIAFLRDNKEANLDVKIQEKSMEDVLGQKHSLGLIGIIPSGETQEVRHGFLKSFVLAVNKNFDLTMLTYNALFRMITGKLSIRESISGPFSIFDITTKAAKVGFTAVIHLIAVLSISLCIFNLLPVPVLDGGHIFLLGIEKIRGKSLNAKIDAALANIGFSLLIVLMTLVSLNDLVRLGYIDRILKLFGK